jgi:diadenosine tetraphosphate (Ap4A) HIT family hydrolase
MKWILSAGPILKKPVKLKLTNLKNGQKFMKAFENLPEDKDHSSAPWTDVVQEDFHVIVYRDKYPVSRGHLLFVPKYNTTHILSEAFNDAFRHGRAMVKSGEWDGFNIGLNYGKAAGQTVEWPHIHLIPRFEGDVEDPVGGVRNIIPGKGNYTKI